jgi:hypothetical protein
MKTHIIIIMRFNKSLLLIYPYWNNNPSFSIGVMTLIPFNRVDFKWKMKNSTHEIQAYIWLILKLRKKLVIFHQEKWKLWCN